MKVSKDSFLARKIQQGDRGNTNDSGGWNVRFLHHIQSGEYGYPTLFKHFTEETIPALKDFGGGSGMGALYLDDERWPKEYNHPSTYCRLGRWPTGNPT